MRAGGAAFRDHFSGAASNYAAFRPTYPSALFDEIASLAPHRRLAWDCATGNGQAACALAPHFARVIATDASATQVAAARPCANVTYMVARAEASGLEPASVSAITVAQALHWFDLAAFAAEAERVLDPGGILAVWGYVLSEVTPGVDAVVRRLHDDILGDWWPPERALVLGGYRDTALPFAPVRTGAHAMVQEWTLAELVGYLRTWSAALRHREANGTDAVSLVEDELRRAWGAPDARREVRWPLHLHVSRR